MVAVARYHVSVPNKDNMESDVQAHRDAARIMREQSTKWEGRGNYSRARFYKSQSSYHDLTADRIETGDDLKVQNSLLVFALSKEVLFGKSGTCGYLVNVKNPNKSIVILEHPTIGMMYFEVPSEMVPGWLELWPQEISDVDFEKTYTKIEMSL